MQKPHRVIRFASLGLVAVLLVITIYSISATVITLQVINQAKESAHMSNLYQQVHYSVSAEDSLLHQYYLNPNSSTWSEYSAAALQLNSLLHMVQYSGDGGDRAFGARMSVDQKQFQLLTFQMSHALSMHQLVQAKTIHDISIDRVFDNLEMQANTAEKADHIQNTLSMNKLDQTVHAIIFSTSIVFAMSLFLFLLFWRLLNGYQRKLNKATQDQLLQMEYIASTDPLTNLPNHRAFIDKVEAEMLRCRTTQSNCAIIFVDVDHFKQINDTWGHAAGDAALFTVGQRLRQCVRSSDYVGRYGGEEFAILLTDVEQYEVVELGERLRLAISDTPCLWQRDTSETSVSIPLTASFGIAVYPLDGLTGKDLIEMADTAMYIAKHSGRNQVCLPDSEQASQLSTCELPLSSRSSESDITEVFALVAQLRDLDTYNHSHRMVDMAAATARQLGRSEEEIALICLAAQLHDIGKIGVPDAILHKPGSLSREEWDVMRCHPETSRQLLALAGGRFELISHIVIAHHERWDGNGYPHKLSQEQIPLGARILSVIDSYDAMTSSRPYHDAISPALAQAELLRCAGGQFDPLVVDAFLQVLQGQMPTGKSRSLAIV
jgi:diguanylate cyclase (GGDEF)-like protein